MSASTAACSAPRSACSSVRHGARAGHAAGRRTDRRHRDRHGRSGPAAGGRDPVHGLHLPGDGSDREPHGAPAQPHPRPPDAARWCCACRTAAASTRRSTTPRAWRRCSCHHPGLRVVCPSSPARAYGLLLAAIRDPDPVIFLEPVRLYRLVRQEVADDGQALPLGMCFVLREGSDVNARHLGSDDRRNACSAAEQLAARRRQLRGDRRRDALADRL